MNYYYIQNKNSWCWCFLAVIHIAKFPLRDYINLFIKLFYNPVNLILFFHELKAKERNIILFYFAFN